MENKVCQSKVFSIQKKRENSFQVFFLSIYYKYLHNFLSIEILTFPLVSIFLPHVSRENYIYNCSSVEISPSLAEIQRQTVGEVRSHQSKFRVECRDAVDLSGWGMFSYVSLNYFFQVLSISYTLFCLGNVCCVC